jgi:hypothetical protein
MGWSSLLVVPGVLVLLAALVGYLAERALASQGPPEEEPRPCTVEELDRDITSLVDNILGRVGDSGVALARLRSRLAQRQRLLGEARRPWSPAKCASAGIHRPPGQVQPGVREDRTRRSS